MRVCKKCNSEIVGKRCKVCLKEYNKIYYQKDPERHRNRRKNYYLNNSELEKVKAKNKRLDNTEKYRQIDKESYQKRINYLTCYNKNYREKNKEYFKEKRTNWKKKKSQDPLYKFFNSIRQSILKSIRKGRYTKNSKTSEILGCSYDEIVKHFESNFESWMTWENRGLYNGEFNYGWDIDHIIPISSAKSEEDIIKLNHYTNLQPLCSKTNRDIKKNKMNWENQGTYWHMDHIIPISSAETEEDVYRLNHYTNFQPLYWLENIRKGDKIE
jgi:hypothetical protein